MNDTLGNALSLAEYLEHRGYETVIVGGAVRDLWIGQPLHDIDLATSAPLETLAALFPDGHPLGRPPLATFLLPWRGSTYETISWAGRTLREDLARRDFTINAMALTTDGETLDPFGGRQDLAAGILRFNGPAEDRLAEDPVRAVRLARFAATLPGFRVPERDRRAVLRASKGLLRRTPPERLGSEILKTLDKGLPKFLELMAAMGLFGQVLPEVAALEGIPQNPASRSENDALTHTLLSVRSACSLTRDRAVRAAALLHDIGKAPGATGNGIVHGHEAVGVELARARMVLWAWPKTLVDTVFALIHCHRLPLLPPDPHALIRLARRHGPEMVNRLFSLSLADLRASGGPQSNWEANRAAFLQGYGRLAKGPLPLDARQIMELLEIPPGPMVGRALSALEEAVADGVVSDAAEAQWFLLHHGAEGFTKAPPND